MTTRKPAPKHKARQPRRVFCHDCKGEVSNAPILCEDCVSRRNEEGMSREDPRTIQTWRRT